MAGEVLGGDALKREIREGRIVVSPMLDLDDQVGEGSIDLRLGTKFITTRRSQYRLMNPKELDASTARSFLSRVHLVFTDDFILHPGQLILAATFEFVMLPTNMCAYVVSRSKYGRAGLLVATAAYVQPGWKGCLTLELLNSGGVPIQLSCGAPIAQIVVHRCEEVGAIPKRPPSLGPEFPDLTEEKSWKPIGSFSQRLKSWQAGATSGE